MQSKQELAKDSPATQHTWVRAAVAGGQTHNLYELPGYSPVSSPVQDSEMWDPRPQFTL